MDALESPQCHLRVELGSADVRMSEHLLDVSDVGPIFMHERGHAVTEQMARSALAQVRTYNVPTRDPSQVIAA
jgi:hypothetical protein